MKLASIISYLTEPMIMATFLVFAGGWHSGMRGSSLAWFVSFVSAFSFLVWVLRIIAVKKLKTNWDISDRKKRVRSLLPLIIMCALFFTVLRIWGNPSLMRFGMSLFVWLVGFSLITLRLKISGHLAVLTLAVGYLIIWYGWPMLAVSLILPPVAWSRLALKRHSPSEIIGGFLYSVSITLLIMVSATQGAI